MKIVLLEKLHVDGEWQIIGMAMNGNEDQIREFLDANYQKLPIGYRYTVH